MTRSATEPATIAMPSSRAQPCTAVEPRAVDRLRGCAQLVGRAERLPALGQQRDVGAGGRGAPHETLGGREVVVGRGPGAQLDARDARFHGRTLEFPAMRRAILIAVLALAALGAAPAAAATPLVHFKSPSGSINCIGGTSPVFVECLGAPRDLAEVAAAAHRLRPRLDSRTSSASGTGA